MYTTKNTFDGKVAKLKGMWRHLVISKHFGKYLWLLGLNPNEPLYFQLMLTKFPIEEQHQQLLLLKMWLQTHPEGIQLLHLLMAGWIPQATKRISLTESYIILPALLGVEAINILIFALFMENIAMNVQLYFLGIGVSPQELTLAIDHIPARVQFFNHRVWFSKSLSNLILKFYLFY